MTAENAGVRARERFEEPPLPAAAVGRRFVQELLGAIGVILPPLPEGQIDGGRVGAIDCLVPGGLVLALFRVGGFSGIIGRRLLLLGGIGGGPGVRGGLLCLLLRRRHDFQLLALDLVLLLVKPDDNSGQHACREDSDRPNRMLPYPAAAALRPGGRSGGDRLSLQPAVQVVRQGLGRFVALACRLLQALQADRFQVGWNVRIQLTRRRGSSEITWSMVSTAVAARNGGRPVRHS